MLSNTWQGFTRDRDVQQFEEGNNWHFFFFEKNQYLSLQIRLEVAHKDRKYDKNMMKVTLKSIEPWTPKLNYTQLLCFAFQYKMKYTCKYKSIYKSHYNNNNNNNNNNNKSIYIQRRNPLVAHGALQ